MMSSKSILNFFRKSNQILPKRCRSVAADYTIKDTKLDSINIEWKTALPYEEIPGPKSLPIFGTILNFIPGGVYGNLTSDQLIKRLRDDYGEIVRLEGLPNRRPCIFIFNPDVCEKMYRVEGTCPTRISIEVLRRYCELNPDRRAFGLSVSQDKEWHDFRSRVNQPMMQPRTVRHHVSQIDQVTNDFIKRIIKLRDPKTLELPATFNNELNKWALESICQIALDHRFGCLEDSLTSNSEPQRMINAVHALFNLLYELELRPSLWKYYNTPKLKQFFKVMDTLTEIGNKHIANAMELLKNQSYLNEEKSMLQRLLAIDEKTARAMAQDMLIAGIDTTANSVGKTLYMIATHPRVQEKLRTEIDAALPDIDSPFTYNTKNDIPYLKACIKEALRISPIALGNLRTMNRDVVLAGFKIPKGMDVIACHSILSKDEKQFPRPNDFIPERWLKDNSLSDNEKVRSAKEAHPFAYMPFGFGSRTCIGRRFAELEMETLIARMIKCFHLEWHHGPLEIKELYIKTVGTPLQFKLIDR